MSFARLALRLSAVEALKGKTGVGDAVFNSRNGALDVSSGGLTTPEDKPFIAVFTETSIDKEPDGQTLRTNKNLDLIFEYAVTQSMYAKNDDGEAVIMPYVPATDEGMELFLDTIGSDIVAALSDVDNEWADVWRSLRGTVVEVERRRVSSEMNNVSLAAQQLRIRVDALPDPVRGEKLRDGSAWAKFISLLKKTENPLTDFFAERFDEENPAQAARRFGLTLAEARALMAD